MARRASFEKIIPFVEAFIGKKDKIYFTVSKSRARGFIDFGEIRFPKSLVMEKDDNRIKEIAEKYACTLSDGGDMYIFTPKVVGEIIDRDGGLLNTSREHQQILISWAKNHFLNLLRELRGWI